MSRMSSNAAGADFISGTCTGFATTPLTISIWVLVFNIISDILCCVGTSGSLNNQYNLALGSTNRAQANEKDTVSSGAQTAGAISSGVWHNITGVFTSHSSRTVYVDGGSNVTDPTARTCGATTAAAVMGNLVGGATPAAIYSHFALWNIALSVDDIRTLQTVPPNNVKPANLVEYWPMRNNQSPELSVGTGGSRLTVVSSAFNTSDPYPQITATLMGQSTT